MKLLISEILDKVSKLKTKKEKIAWLKEQNTDGLRMVIKSSFDPKKRWLLPTGDVPFTRNAVSYTHLTLPTIYSV